MTCADGIHTFYVSDIHYDYGDWEREFTCYDCHYQCRGPSHLMVAIAATGSSIPELGLKQSPNVAPPPRRKRLFR